MRYLIGLLLPFTLLACATAGSGEPTPAPSVSASVAAASAVPWITPPPDQGLPRLSLGDTSLLIELACTADQQQQGLMFRRDLPEQRGMLFVFAQERVLSFWMRNTYVPLSIAYIDAKGKIVDLQDMQPLDETGHPSAAPARYALEVKQGWFKRHGVAVGDQIKLDSFCAHR